MIEFLESRIAPAGIVTCVLTNGVLSFTGDDADNQISISPVGGGDYRIDGVGGTLFDNGNGGQVGFFVLSGTLLGLKVDLRGGADVFDATGLKVAGATNLLGGDGNDTFTLNNHTLLGPVTINGGIGHDTVTFGGSYTIVRSKLTLTDTDGSNSLNCESKSASFTSIQMTTGAGSDALTFNNVALRTGAITADFGDGENTFSANGKTATFGSTINLKYGSHATGASQFNLQSEITAVASAVTLQFADGDNLISLSGTTSVRVGGLLKVTSGSGGDAFSLTGGDVSTGAGMMLALGDGTNSVSMVGSNFNLAGDVSVTSGVGIDTFTLDASTLVVGKKLLLQTGDGSNSATVHALNGVLKGGVQYFGGSGQDLLDLNGSFRSGALNVQFGAGAAGLNTSGVRQDFAAITINAPTLAGENLSVQSVVNEFRVKTTTSITTGAGLSSVEFGSPDSYVTLTGDVIYLGGAGEDVLRIKAAEGRIGSMKLDTGAGDSTIQVTSDFLALAGFRFRAADGFDRATIETLDGVVGLVDVNTGAGISQLTVQSTSDLVRVKGINFNTPETNMDATTLSIAKATVLGATNVNGGDGATVVTMADSIFTGPVLMQTRGGMDQVTVDTTDDSIPSKFLGIFSVSLGAGDDTLFVGNNTFGGHASFFATVLVDAGADNDTTDLVTDNGNFFRLAPVIKNSETSS
jgi:hypothetical protein